MNVRIPLLLAGFLGCIIVICPISSAEEQTDPERPMEGVGTWTKSSAKRLFAFSDQGVCRQMWSCGPAEPIAVADDTERLVFGAEQITEGTCKQSADTSCRSCEAPKPSVLCVWKIERVSE